MPFVEIDQPRPHVTRVTLNRPDRKNAMAFDVMVPLREALEQVSTDNDCRVVILTGAGSAFCAGADLEDPGLVPHMDGLTVPKIARRAMRVLEDVMHAVNEMHQPVIAAINGPAVGGGLCLAMAADVRIAGRSALFRAAGINNGLTAMELGLSYLLPRAIGSSRAFEIMLSGRDVEAAEAERIGLVARTVPDDDLFEACFETADRLIAHSQLGVELTKQMLWAGLEAGSLRSHMTHEGVSQLYVRLTTNNFEEAIRARKARRAPKYED
ncbi:MAG: enoyl-CoA hydratase [Myxococcales bacterium]|nr:enoyl-CoA hydratase [Myxococcales bacterium]